MLARLPRPLRLLLLSALLVVPSGLAQAQASGPDERTRLHPPVVVQAAAVAHTDEGLRGSVATVSVSLAEPGSGHVFVDTYPLTQVDMQGSIRLAVRTAAALADVEADAYDYFVVVRAESQLIGGPSAGGILTAGMVTALMNAQGRNWTVDPDVLMTGTINPDGSIGPVGGIPEKAAAAADVGARVFLYPAGQGRVPAMTSSGPTVVNMSAYCRETLRITCLPVATALEAVEQVTGHRISVPIPAGNVTTARFRDVLGPLASELVENSSAALSEARQKLTQARGIQGGLRETLVRTLGEGSLNQDEAEDAFDEEAFYAAASKSFQASISARTVSGVVGLLQEGDPAAYVRNELDLAEREVDRALRATRGANATTLEELQAFGAAESRALQAARGLETARAKATVASTGNDLVDVMSDLAFTIERARTAPWWVRIGERFSATGDAAPLPEGFVEDVARDTLDDATSLLTYAEVVLQQAGAGAEPLQAAFESIAQAQVAFEDGLASSAIFDALEAQVAASLALELAGYGEDVPEEKVAQSRASAQAAILDSRARGVEPVLAVAYFEFAEALPAKGTALQYYNLARIVAKLTGFQSGSGSEPRESRFVGSAGARAPASVLPSELLTGFLLLGASAGATLGLITGLLWAHARRRPDGPRPVAGVPLRRVVVTSMETPLPQAARDEGDERRGEETAEEPRILP